MVGSFGGFKWERRVTEKRDEGEEVEGREEKEWRERRGIEEIDERREDREWRE